MKKAYSYFEENGITYDQSAQELKFSYCFFSIIFNEPACFIIYYTAASITLISSHELRKSSIFSDSRLSFSSISLCIISNLSQFNLHFASE
ncbi:MAG TPA: hypothetical protein DCE11_09000 [Ruminiclostridium sp.]|nr:hypothetical protein [Ruminiclostridium sp.]